MFGEAALSLLLLKLLVVVITPKFPGDGKFVTGTVASYDRGEGTRVAELNVVQDVERLHAKLHGDTLGEFRFFDQRKIDLPAIEGTDNTVWGIAKASEVAIRVHRRSREGGCVNQGYAVVSAARQSQWNTRE